MARSSPSRSRCPQSSSPTFRLSRTCNTGRFSPPYTEDEYDEEELLEQIQRLQLPNSNIIHVLSERYCTRVLLSISRHEREGHWFEKRGGEDRGRPKTNIGSHMITVRDLTKEAGFLEDRTARSIQDLLLSAFHQPSTRSNPQDHSLPLRLQVLAARSHYNFPTKPKPPSSRKPLQSSHLCHKPTCFSPSHVILETQATNLARNDCRNAINLMVETGQNYKHLPCTHGDEVTGVPSCLLAMTCAKIVVERRVVGGMAEMRRAKKERREKECRVMKLSKGEGGAAKTIGRAVVVRKTRSLGFDLIVYK